MDAGGNVLSRAIFAFMEGESRNEGMGVFSLFGVHTPCDFRQRGYAGVNLSRLMARVAELGGSRLEIHVYADNLPALALYRRAGFREAVETVMLHRYFLPTPCRAAALPL
jgi:predicted GNAT family acetyltransferase